MELKESIAQWEFNSRADAFWSVLSAPDKLGGKWEPEEFFRTGDEAIFSLLAHLKRLGLTINAGRALDFGCGVGRLTQALAPSFQRVDGVDAAPTMIELARKYNRYAERVSYHLNQVDNLMSFPSGGFNFVLSLIVLQHVPTQSALSYLREFMRILAPSGVLVFQVPSHPKVVARSLGERGRQTIKSVLPPFLLDLLRRNLRPHQPVIPMCPIPREKIEALFTGTDVQLIHIEPDAWAGEQWHSFTYYARKD